MEELKQIPTKVLLKYLKRSRKCGSSFWSPYDNGVGWTTEQLKEELATREHIPNKLETKKLRQQAAKRGK